ncbi:VIT domain-containing protein [Seonamhaeicola marinus]|uniref:TonB-dependent receptor plug domain-containing protein n=1 Tax=Seonamhaeicola marinus TaxID=1912246 RepID=A0A5D0IAA7_9FLAO|nr:carboxypeptidase-like regulatory domain-containing protein [Seonamhaeicola marinus]TYA78702.1 TonB-dependent receptor plug domain-containing protein [Seonamhaeicola marinus]
MRLLSSILFLLLFNWGFSQNIPTIKVGEERLGITSLDIKTVVIGNIATTTYDMLFYNPSNTILEGELAFPLGEGQSVSRLALEINGKLREAVVVEKELGRVAFEAVVRRGVDPVLLEKGTGNNYKARIYPIPANGHKRVVLAYEQELVLSQGQYHFQLPLSFNNVLDDFKLEMNVIGQTQKPEVSQSKIENFAFSEISNGYFAKVEKQNYQPKELLTIKIPQVHGVHSTIVFNDYFYAHQTLDITPRERKKAKKITLLWDISLSMKSRDLDKELLFLDAYLKHLGNVNIQLIKFSNTIKNKEDFKIKDGNWKTLRETLENSIYDGGTSFTGLLEHTMTDEILLFSDGMKNLSTIVTNHNVPLVVINSIIKANHQELNTISSLSNGVYINIKNLAPNEALNKVKYASLNYLGYESSNKNLEVYPSVSKIVSEDFSITGRHFLKNDTLVLKFGYGNNVSLRKEVILKADYKNPLVKRFWAQSKLNELQKDSEANKEAIIKHSKAYNVVSNHTSLIVLETVWDYVKYEIVPPIELREAYFKILKEQKGKKIATVSDAIETDEDNQNLTQFTGTGNISGTVTDTNGSPLPGVNVMVKGTSIGTTTDFDGNYSINASEGADLVFSFIGMHPLETTIGNSSTVNIKMEEDASELEEVVVVGYGSVRRTNVTGAVSVITSEDISNYATVPDALRGKVAGLNVSSNNGVPGASPNITIRGASSLSNSNQPLYVIDGIPVEGNIDDFITPAEIQSINVIKDVAEASIYGSRASNGVIVINTRMGNFRSNANSSNDSMSSNNRERIKKYKGRLEVKEIKVNEVYLKELNGKNDLSEAYRVYLTQREKFLDNTTYFIDVSNFFLENGNKEIAMTILTNVAEIDFDNYEHLRVLAYTLEERGAYELASFIYAQVLQLRSEDSQSYRDLALAYQEIGLRTKSNELLDSIISGAIYKGKQRRVFDGIKQISENEISKAKVPNSEATESRKKSFDIRVVIDWNHNDTDIDLHVIDPNLEECFYSHTTTKMGGKISKDMTQGFGPEEFTLKHAEKGVYYIKVNYYADRYQKLNTPTFMKVTMFKNYGKPNESKEIKVVRLSKKNENIIVAKLVI